MQHARICIAENSHKMLYGPLVHVRETVTDLQILGCELPKNASGSRAPPGPAGSSPYSLAVIKGRKGRERKKRVGNGERGGRDWY